MTDRPAIKPLDWQEIHQARSNEDPRTEVVGFEADAGFASHYTIEVVGGGFTVTDPEYETWSCVYPSEDAAKAAAQANFASRIRSCLLDKPEAVEGDAAGEGWTGKKCPHCNGHGIRADIDGEERRCTDCAGTGDEYGCKFIGPEGFFHDQFEKPVETDTPLQSAAREAGWALSTLVDEIKFEKRQQVVNIINRLSAAFYALYAPADTDATQSEIDRLRRELEEARKALENARAQILSAYRVWVADDVAAFPPPKTQAGEVIAQIDAILAAKEQQPSPAQPSPKPAAVSEGGEDE